MASGGDRVNSSLTIPFLRQNEGAGRTMSSEKEPAGKR